MDKVIDKEESFNCRSSTCTPRRIHKDELFEEDNKGLALWEVVPIKVQAHLGHGIFLATSELESRESTTIDKSNEAILFHPRHGHYHAEAAYLEFLSAEARFVGQ